MRQAGDRIAIIAGGGLQLDTLTEVVRRSGVFCLHGSLTRKNGAHAAEEDTAVSGMDLLEADVREAVRLLRREIEERTTGGEDGAPRNGHAGAAVQNGRRA
jgi:copper homeostasis protein CutC